MIENLDKKFKKCFELAVQGETLAFPNPNVACLIYFREKLIAHGIHQEFGKAHAEVIAIEKLKNYYKINTELQKEFSSITSFIEECELIVNLEPCDHYGNTPPCTLLIKESGFKKIAFAAYDTNPKVFKKSLLNFPCPSYELIKPEDLNKELQEEALFVNRAFFTIKEKEASKKLATYLTVKIASYPDGNMITRDSDKWITGEASRKDVHRLRSTSQVLITTSSTVKVDKPKYTVRHEAKELNLLDIKDPDICVVYNKEEVKLDSIQSSRKVFYEKLDNLKQEALEQLIQKLAFQGYQKIMVEAGPKLSHAFLESGLVDELIAYQPKSGRSEEEFVEDCKKAFKLDNGGFPRSFLTDYQLIYLSPR